MAAGKNGKRKPYHIPYNIELLGRISSGEKGRKIRGRNSRLRKVEVGKNTKLQGTLYTPELFSPNFRWRGRS